MIRQWHCYGQASLFTWCSLEIDSVAYKKLNNKKNLYMSITVSESQQKM